MLDSCAVRDGGIGLECCFKGSILEHLPDIPLLFHVQKSRYPYKRL